ncbi:DUF5313 family protein [Antrihabitans cavernicola]|uniref:DUF5313 domain-containing protein n=1 Tax=Antrihabitans cavernicola TaxID=2495913 RepID=A0A5A7S7H8_9NOCA|nr:DUF5313 family protein [Spelaeibacter cavernicola]KAA0021139.1 hypothetical protein FOY51_19660 [Spelaeibacter cavernicola]
MNTPSITQRIRYDLGFELPESHHDWVRNDLVGPGSMERYLIRFLLPVLPFFGLVFLLGGDVWLEIAMIAIMLVPLIVFTISLTYVFRRSRLIQHGLDPALLDRTKFSDYERLRYRMNYGH